MRKIMNINKSNMKCSDNRSPKDKKQIHATGILINRLIPGSQAVYLYHGTLIQTSVVMAILEAAPDYVQFETLNSIYTIAYERNPSENVKMAV